ncbi:MAG: hypothetical protein QM731_15800 [Chitinophagaceae bacterium]
MRQGVHKFERSMCGLTFYRLHNKWYIRRRSSLTGRRFKTSKRFEKSRQSAAKMGIASKLAASVYRELPPAWKLYDLYKKLTALATRLLHEGANETAIPAALQQQLYNWGYRKEIHYPVIQQHKKLIVLRTPEECKRAESRKYEAGCRKSEKDRRFTIRPTSLRQTKYRRQNIECRISNFEYRRKERMWKCTNGENRSMRSDVGSPMSERFNCKLPTANLYSSRSVLRLYLKPCNEKRSKAP